MSGTKLTLNGQQLTLPADTITLLSESGKPILLLGQAENLAVIGSGSPVPEAASHGTVILAGDLGRFPPPDLFGMLTMAQKSGMLRLSFHTGEISVYFERGEIVFATSNIEEDRLGTFLYGRGVIDKNQLREAERNMRPDTRFGKILVELGYITPKVLWENVHLQVEEIVYSVFGLRLGSFFFLEGDSLLPEDLSGITLSSQSLLMEGIRRSDEMAMIEEVIPQDDAVPVRRDSAPKTDLSDFEGKVLALCDGRRTVSQIIRGSKRGDFEAKRALYDLARAKFIEVRVPGESAKQDPKQRMLDAISEYNQIFGQLYQDMKSYATGIDVDQTLASFFDDLSGSRFEGVFVGASTNAAGQLEPDKLMANLDKLQTSGGSTLAIAGLAELMNYELLVDGLNEFLNFLIFSVRNSCENAKAEEIIKKIRQIQSGLMS
ncbi:MAG: DUF4388 domain-containing protein [Chrysiogenetes bacterium]|nr:DUF4388 domain-containing protein [Chrysiogenetes bacterium]